MNLKEGTRRLALLLGVVGAILGGFASYVELQSVIRQRADHMRFEQLANSDVVKDQRKILQSPDPFASIAKPIPEHGRAKLSDLDPPTPQPQLDWSKSIPLPSKVSKGGIETINWSHDYVIASIETEDGQTLYPTPAPSAWLYLLIALFPILGFFIPWGAVRAIGWVGAGFIASGM